jgi:hypothetical protein
VRTSDAIADEKGVKKKHTIPMNIENFLIIPPLLITVYTIKAS